MTLYEIKESFLKLLDMDLDEQAMADTLESLEFDLEEKADNIACLIKSLEAESEAIKVEAKKLQDRSNGKQTKADKLKEYLYQTFKALDKAKLETSRNVLTIKKNPVSVVLDEGFNNPNYMMSKTTCVPDKVKIKYYIERGEEVIGARLEQKERLEIK